MKVSLRKTTDKDFPDFQRWITDYKNGKWLASVFRDVPYSAIFHSLMIRKKTSMVYTILVEKKSVGFVEIRDIDRMNLTANIGYVLGEHEHRNRGITTEAVGLFLKKLFSFRKFHAIYAHVVRSNKASISVLEKNGFKRAGIMRESHRDIGGVFHDKLIYDILGREFWK